MARGEISVFLAGDCLIVRPWSQIEEPAFLRLIELVRNADVAITNLETVIHEFKSPAQADCGGIHLASPPNIAQELKWAGFDMVAHANNHTFDYGSGGVLETLEHVGKAGLILAGSGRNLQEARAPRYFRCKGGAVALVAMASTFVPYGKASHARRDLHGRPGLNPLAYIEDRAILLPERALGQCRAILRRLGRKGSNHAEVPLAFGFRLRASDHFEIVWKENASADLQANLLAISEAASKGDVVVVSVHAHRNGAWLRDFARSAIKLGANMVFIHGPHRVRGIELYRGSPIFHSLGNFVFEVEHVRRLPAEDYERLGLAPDAAFEALQAAIASRPQDAADQMKTFEGVAALVSVAEGSVTGISLLPIDLQFHARGKGRGRPQIAPSEVANRIFAKIATLSRRFGTELRYDPKSNCAEVVLPTSTAD